MALRPGTTATRAEIADIERAMSSASPMTRDDLMPGCRLQLVERDDGAGTHVDDLAFDPEVIEDAFQQSRVLLQRVLGNVGTGLALGFRQHCQRRQHVGADLLGAGDLAQRRAGRPWGSAPRE